MNILIKTLKENWWKALIGALLFLLFSMFFWKNHYESLSIFNQIFFFMIGWLSVDYIKNLYEFYKKN